MASETWRTVGKAMTGCGCLSLLAITAWLVFVAWVGLQGRGNDEEASVIIGGVTCALSLPVLLATVVGLVLALRRPGGHGA